MQALFKFLSSLFSPRNYTEMLRKLSFFLLWEIWIATFFLREIPQVDNGFHILEQFGPIKSIASLLPASASLNVAGFIIAFLVVIVTYAIQLHDRISDWFGIRKRFDRQYILLPLATLVGVKLTARQRRALDSDRDSILRKVFYPYVSSRARKALVDKHDIERALDGWSWYWILIEAMPFAIICAIISAIYGSYSFAVGFLAGFLVLLLSSWLYSFRLPRLARPEIEAIVANNAARNAVRNTFRAL